MLILERDGEAAEVIVGCDVQPGKACLYTAKVRCGRKTTEV